MPAPFGMAGGAPGAAGHQPGRARRRHASRRSTTSASVEMAAGRRLRDRDARRRRLRQGLVARRGSRTAKLGRCTHHRLPLLPPRLLAARGARLPRHLPPPSPWHRSALPAARRRRPGRSSACRSRPSPSRASPSSTSTASAPSRSRPTCRTATSSMRSRTSPRRRSSAGSGGSRSRSRRPTCARSAATTPRSRSASSSTCRWTAFRSPIASCCAWRAARRAIRCRPRPSATSGIRSWRPERRSTTRSRAGMRYIVLESGSDRLNKWMAEKRDVGADFLKLFGDEIQDRAADRRRRRSAPTPTTPRRKSVAYVSGVSLEP